MSFTIIQQDITKMKVDAIVNAANCELLQGGGVCGAIFNAAGAKLLQEACKKLGPIKTGEAVTTPGFNLPAKYIIHTAGPIYNALNHEKCEELLYKSYKNSLNLAIENDFKSIAFPLISSGIYGYPKKEAFIVAVKAIRDFLKTNDIDVTLTMFDKSSFDMAEKLMREI